MEELIRLLDKDLEYIEHEIIDGCIHIKIASKRTRMQCPFCGVLSDKVHSTYERSFQDLPIQGMKVILILINRKVFCRNAECGHTTFAERFEFLSGKSKKTKRLETEIIRLSLNMSSVAAAELLSQNTVSVGKSTVCRLLKRGAYPQGSTKAE